MAKPTMIGKLLASIRFERQKAREATSKDLWDRNKLQAVADREGYKIEERRIVTKDGAESIKLELWKKVDEQVVNLRAEFITEMVKDKLKGDDWDL